MSLPGNAAELETMTKLVLGLLPPEEVEKLTEKYLHDERFQSLAESIAMERDTLLESLRHQPTLADQPDDELARRLMERIKLQYQSDTATRAYAQQPASPMPIPDSLEYFKVLKVLGQGGMGTVYLAEDTRLHRKVAIKTLKRELAEKPNAKERFLREARSAAKLEHDNIIPIYYVGESEGIPFLAMPLLQGETLEARIAKAEANDSKISIGKVVEIARQMATGLSFAHQRGLIHRDIKPANIWIEEPSQRVKILDFGLARQDDDDASLTASGAILGTPAYMSPEQARGQAIDARADLFSLGCVLYEMLAGARPFAGPTTIALLTSLAVDEPPSPNQLNPEVPVELSQLTMRLLSKDATHRPESAAVVLDELISIEASVAVRRPKRSMPPYWIAIAAGLLALLLILWYFAGDLLRFETPDGTLVVEIADKETEAHFKNGEIRLVDSTGAVRYTLKPSDKNKHLPTGKYQVQVMGADGLKLDVEEFTIAKGKETAIRVWMEKPATGTPAGKTNASAESSAETLDTLKWVLSKRKSGHGDAAHVDAGGKFIRLHADSPLPTGPIRILSIELHRMHSEQITDDDLKRIGKLTDLQTLNFGAQPITVAGLQHLKNLKEITALDIFGQTVTDAGALVRSFNKLEYFVVPSEDVDAWVANLAGMKALRELYFPRGNLTVKGIESLQNLPALNKVTFDKMNSQIVDFLPALEKNKQLRLITFGDLTSELAAKIDAFALKVPWCEVRYKLMNTTIVRNKPATKGK